MKADYIIKQFCRYECSSRDEGVCKDCPLHEKKDSDSVVKFCKECAGEGKYCHSCSLSKLLPEEKE